MLEIGGSDVLTYGQMITRYARLRGLRGARSGPREIFPFVPVGYEEAVRRVLVEQPEVR